MPIHNKQPFEPNPIPEVSIPDEEVFYLHLTNEIFKSHDEFFERFLYCNSLIWTCGRTGKSGLTYAEALESEQQGRPKKKKGGKRPKPAEGTEDNGDGTETPVKKKKKKYPYDPKKYSMPVPEGFDPNLLTPTGKIDGRKLKSKKNKQLAEELLAASISNISEPEDKPKRGRHKKKDDVSENKEDEGKKKEEEAKRKANLQAELAKEKELEAKRKKEAIAMAKQVEKQKKEEERKKAASFLQNWEKKCEDLERDDLKRLPPPTPLSCDIPERLFGDAVFILESLYNLHDLYNIHTIYPDGISYDTLEEMLIERQEEGPLGIVIQFLLRLIFDTQPTGHGYGLDDDQVKVADSSVDVKQEEVKVNNIKPEIASTSLEVSGDHDHENSSEQDEDDENVDKDVKMNDLIGSAIKAAQEVKKSLNKPLPERELNSTNMTDILRLHLLQSGSFPKGRTIYNGWYSSREDPGLWLCMQEPDLIKKLGEAPVYELEIEERIKILHTLIYQLFSFIRTRLYIESASDTLTELRKQYRKEAADFAKWDRENCVKRMQAPKKRGDQNPIQSIDNKPNGIENSDHIKVERSNPGSINGDINDLDEEGGNHPDKESNNNSQQLKSCLKANGNSSVDIKPLDDTEENGHSKKKITFKTGQNGVAIEANGFEECETNEHESNATGDDPDSEQNYEELEKTYQQNLTDYEDYQRERAHKLEELNESLIVIRDSLRKTQSVYGVHPIGRDRAYRRYWIFQSLPGLFVEQDDNYVGKCLPQPTPLESRYKKLFNKENPLMHPNEADLIRTKTCDVACSADMPPIGEEDELHQACSDETGAEGKDVGALAEVSSDAASAQDRLAGSEHPDDQEDPQEGGDFTSDEMNYCTGDETTCSIHGQKRPTQTRWWFYHSPESIDNLIECLNKRGYRESELHDVLSAESSIIKPRVAECPAFKLNKYIMEQSGIRRSRRLRTKKRRD